jgi:hypothetical protein
MTTKDKSDKKNVHQHPNADKVEIEVALLKQSISIINETLIRMESSFNNQFRDLKDEMNRRFDKVDERFDKMDKKFDRVDDDIKDLRRDNRSDFWRYLSVVVAFGSGIVGVMAHGFHWF